MSQLRNATILGTLRSVPAALRGLFDRALLPGWAFRVTMPVQGLTDRSGRVLVTMDAPTWYDAIVNRASARNQVARATLGFGSIAHSSTKKRAKMLAQAKRLGLKEAQRIARTAEFLPTDAALSSDGKSAANRLSA